MTVRTNIWRLFYETNQKTNLTVPVMDSMAVAHKGSISMGLVLIPVGLYKTTVDNDIHFNQLCKESKERIQYKKYCRHCDKEIKGEDIIKGYEYEKGKYVVMTNEELEKIKTKKDKTNPTKDGIIVKTLFYQDEIMEMPKAVPKMKLDENELKMAKLLIENMTKPFDAAAFHDEYQERLRAAITKKYRVRKSWQWIPAVRLMSLT